MCFTCFPVCCSTSQGGSPPGCSLTRRLSTAISAQGCLRPLLGHWVPPYHSDSFLLFGSFAMAVALTGRAKMEARLSALLENNDVTIPVMDRLGDAGVITLSLFSNIGLNREKFVEFIEKPPILIKADDVPAALEQAKVIGCWEQARTMREVETRARAERIAQRLPPPN